MLTGVRRGVVIRLTSHYIWNLQNAEKLTAKPANISE